MGQDLSNDSSVKDSWLSFGVVGRAYGIKGWVHIHSTSEVPADILAYDNWRLTWPNGQVRHLAIEAKKAQGADRVVVKFKDCNDRDAARLLTGAEIGIERAQMPSLEEDEDYYLADLVGWNVVALSGKALGTVVRFFSNGAHDIVVLKTSEDKDAKQVMLPFVVDDTVTAILPDHRQIQMDWPDEH